MLTGVHAVLSRSITQHCQLSIYVSNQYSYLCLRIPLTVRCRGRYFGPKRYSGVPRNFVRGGGDGGFNKFSWGQRERGSEGGSPLVRGSGSSCNLVQEIFISYSKIFLIFDTLRLFMMTTNLFVIANVKQLRIGGSFRMLLPFFWKSWGVGVLNWAIFNSFQNRVEFGTIF